MDQWVEVEGKTVEVAIRAAMEELGIDSKDDAKIEIIQEPRPGFIGIGGQMAQVKVSRERSNTRKNRRRRRKRTNPKNTQEKSQKEHTGTQQSKNKPNQRRDKASGKDRTSKSGRTEEREDSAVTTPEINIQDQADLAKEFLEGLLVAFGLEGEVVTRVEDDILLMEISGDQTEALVGAKGNILQAINELTRTVIQRKTYRAPRMRLDIAGYNERRREALKIFAGKVAQQVLESGGEVMLEPMNPADRKVLHDAIAEIQGVRSFSEGRDPKRSVVIAPLED